MSRFIRVTRGQPGTLNSEGLEVLRMALWDGGKEVAHVQAYSGAPDRQHFRTLALERRGVLEPCPEGVYHHIGGLEWAGKPGDYSASWDPGLGPVVIEVYGERAIMIHWDANRAWAPGSAGCLCPITLDGLKTVVGWWLAGPPEWVECDWGLGTVRKPLVAGAITPAVAPKLVTVAFDAHDGRMQARQFGQVQPSLTVKLDHHSGKFGLWLNGVQIEPDRVKAVGIKVVYEQS